MFINNLNISSRWSLKENLFSLKKLCDVYHSNIIKLHLKNLKKKFPTSFDIIVKFLYCYNECLCWKFNFKPT